MGFRGEALAAISAVSHITLTTRQRGAASGTHMTLDAGDIQDMYETGCPEGTTMIVRDLFFNTPARRKFLKSDRAEGAACAAAALRCALGRPDVSVRCIRDGEEVFFSPGDNKLDSCVYSLLGRDLAMSLLPCEGEADGARVHGFISSPAAGRGSRAQQYFFCNGRWIRSAALQAALEQAYRNTLLVGRFPACVLYVELSCAAVDVNVHPAKTEVKFTHERAVFDAVYYGARAALEAEKAPVTTLAKAAARPAPAPKADPFVPAAPKAAPAAPRVTPPPVFSAPARPMPATPAAPEPAMPAAQIVQTAIEPEAETLPDAETLRDRSVQIRQEDGVFFVEAPWLLRLMRGINFDDSESLQYFEKVLRSAGVIDALTAAGVAEGDTVCIYDFEFEFVC